MLKLGYVFKLLLLLSGFVSVALDARKAALLSASVKLEDSLTAVPSASFGQFEDSLTVTASPPSVGNTFFVRVMYVYIHSPHKETCFPRQKNKIIEFEDTP